MSADNEQLRREKADQLLGAFRLGLQPLIQGYDDVEQAEDWLDFSEEWLVLAESPEAEDEDEFEGQSLAILELRGLGDNRGWYYAIEEGVGQGRDWVDCAGPFLTVDSLFEACRARISQWNGWWDPNLDEMDAERQDFVARMEDALPSSP